MLRLYVYAWIRLDYAFAGTALERSKCCHSHPRNSRFRRQKRRSWNHHVQLRHILFFQRFFKAPE